VTIGEHALPLENSGHPVAALVTTPAVRLIERVGAVGYTPGTVLRNMLHWFLMRDLDRRRAAVQVENNDFLARLDDIQRRSRRLADERDHLLAELRRQSDDELALSEQLLSGARVGDEESQSRLDAWMQGAAQRSRDRTAQADAFTADAEALQAEAERLARDQARVRDESAAISTTQTRRIATVAKATLALELLTAALGLIPYGRASVRSAYAIHLEYYAAVAEIVPVLLIAGFVELAILGFRSAVWAVLNLAVPAIGAGAGALVVLATHDSTPYTRFLTIWGLAATMASLIGFVVMHTTSSTRI
jgi:hypothetical protein